MGRISIEGNATRVEFSPEQRTISIEGKDAMPIMIENPNKTLPKPDMSHTWIAIAIPIAVALIGLYGSIYQAKRKQEAKSQAQNGQRPTHNID